MTGSDTHADTIRHALDVAHPVTGQDHDDVDAAPAALDALVAEVERERARADQAEAARDAAWGADRHGHKHGEPRWSLLEIETWLKALGADQELQDGIAALSAGSGGREPT